MKCFLAIGFILILSLGCSIGQGCSDAGFCTLGALKLSTQDTIQQQFTFILPAGVGDEVVFILTPTLQFDKSLGKRWTVQTRLTANYASGSLGTAAGAGDLFFAGTYTLNQSKWQTDLTLGIKIPLNGSDLNEGGLSMPMVYQSSLGTLDVIAGISVKNSHWQIAVGWQQPLTTQNDNAFNPTDWNNAEAEKFLPTNHFERQADALLRIAYTLKNQSRIALTGGLLAIYHTQDDRYTRSDTGAAMTLVGSQGLTLNATLMGRWSIHKRVQFQVTLGAPLVAREVRPDGLTRAFVFAPEVVWRF